MYSEGALADTLESGGTGGRAGANYPSKGGVGEKGARFRDSEGNLIGLGQPVR
jgi:hypothetical protein